MKPSRPLPIIAPGTLDELLARRNELAQRLMKLRLALPTADQPYVLVARVRALEDEAAAIDQAVRLARGRWGG